MWDFTCPVCQNESCILPAGPKKSPILLVGDEPGQQEIAEGRPFAGPTGGVLRTELARLGVDIAALRMTNLWLHDPDAYTGTKKEQQAMHAACLEHSAKKVLEEARGRKAVLLMGSEPVHYFCDVSVEEYNGLEVPSLLLAPARVLVCVQPAMVFHKSVGELRFALKRFADILHQEKLV